MPKPKDGKSTSELEPDNSPCAICFVQNPSMLWTYVMNTCKLRYIFTNVFTTFVLFIIFISFLFRHFTIADEAPFNLNFNDYCTFARTFSRTNYIDCYEKYFFKHETLRKKLQNSHITLHAEKDPEATTKRCS